MSHPAHPTLRPSAFRRWARAGAGLLALAVGLQASLTVVAQAAEPAHRHVAPASEAQRDPMLDGVRVVQNHHAAGERHAHSHVERHAHDAADATVLHLDDDDTAAGAQPKDSSGKRAAADLDTPTISLPPEPAAPPANAWTTANPCAYRSHVGTPLERPPR